MCSRCGGASRHSPSTTYMYVIREKLYKFQSLYMHILVWTVLLVADEKLEASLHGVAGSGIVRRSK